MRLEQQLLGKSKKFINSLILGKDPWEITSQSRNHSFGFWVATLIYPQDANHTHVRKNGTTYRGPGKVPFSLCSFHFSICNTYIIYKLAQRAAVM